MNLGRWLVADIVVFLLFLTPLVSASPSSETTNPSEWRMFGRDLNHTRYYPGYVNLTSFGLLWNFSTGTEMYPSPAVVNGIAYVGSFDSNIYALNASTGSKLWNYSTDTSLQTSPAIAGDVIYVASFDRIYAINGTNGQTIWVSDYSLGAGESSPTVVDNVIYVGSSSGNNNVYAINASTGAEIWHFSTSGSILSSPAVTNKIVYVGSIDANLYALNATNGELIWNYTTGGEVHSSPTLSNGIVYVTSELGPIYALNASNGDLIWVNNKVEGCFSSPAIAKGIVYVGSCNSKVFALNATTGDHIWNYTTESGVLSSPSVSDNLVFAGTWFEDGHFYVLNSTSGNLLWSYFVGHNSIMASPAIVDGVVYITSCDGNIYAFGQTAPAPSGGGHGISTRKYDLQVDILGSTQFLAGKEMTFFVHKKAVTDFPLYGIPIDITADSGQRFSTITDSSGIFYFSPNTTGSYELNAGGTSLYRLYSVAFNVTGPTIQTTTTTSTTSSTMKITTTTSPSLTTTSTIPTSTTTSSSTTTTIKNSTNPVVSAKDDNQSNFPAYPIFLFVSIALVGILLIISLTLDIHFFRRARPIKDKCTLGNV